MEYYFLVKRIPSGVLFLLEGKRLKEEMLAALSRTRADAEYFVYEFTGNGSEFRSKKFNKVFVEALIKKCSEVVSHKELSNCWMISKDIGVGLGNFEENIYYETPDTEGYLEHICKYNKYYKVYIRLDKEKKTIEFKLGDRYKKLELKENADYVSKPSRNKMLCVSAEELEKFIHDRFWNPRMVRIGRLVLKIPELRFK